MRIKRSTAYKIGLGCLLALLLIYNIVLIFSKKVFLIHANSDGIGELSYLQATWEQKSFFPEGFMHSNETFAIRPVLIFLDILWA